MNTLVPAQVLTAYRNSNNAFSPHPHFSLNSMLLYSSSFLNYKKTHLDSRSGISKSVVTVSHKDSDVPLEDEVDDIGVKAALSVLQFYKIRSETPPGIICEISPLLPKSCRYVPTCSEYSMIAYKKYGFVKGSALTAWRICRCNPLGGTGFDPPRWFGEPEDPRNQ